MYLCWLINCNKYTTLDVNNGENCVKMAVERVYGNSLLSAQFFCKLKAVLKNFLLILKRKRIQETLIL